MSDVMELYKIPGWKVRARTFIVTDGEPVQVRLDFGHAQSGKNRVTQDDILNVVKE